MVTPRGETGGKPKGKKAGAVQDRRAAPVSKVFTILAKNKVQKARLPLGPA